VNSARILKLNVEESEKPKNLTVNIDHKEPSLKHAVTGTERQGNPSNIQFLGAIDASEVSWKIVLHLQKSIFSVIAVLRQLSTGCMGFGGRFFGWARQFPRLKDRVRPLNEFSGHAG